MEKNRQVDKLFSEFGKMIGIEELSLDQENRCVLEFDNQVVNFHFNEEQDTLMIFSDLGKIRNSDARPLYKELLTANFYREQMSNSALSYSPETDSVVLLLDQSIQGIGFRKFDDLIENFVNIAMAWTLKISQTREDANPKISGDNNTQANWISV